jgi:hypothetical protein
LLSGSSSETTTPRKTRSSQELLLFIINLTDPQGDPKSQIQLPEMALLLSSVMADPAWLCLNDYLRCVSTCSLLPSTTLQPSNLFLKALFVLFPLRSLFVRSLFFFLSLTHSLTHKHTHKENISLLHTHKQKSSKSSVSSQPLTHLLATILSKIVNYLRPLLSNLHHNYSSYDLTPI